MRARYPGAMLSLLLLFGICMVLAPNTAAETITVSPSGSGNFTTIQEALDASSDYDTVEIWEGVYDENIQINESIEIIGNGSVILSDGGVAVTVFADFANIDNLTVLFNGSSPAATDIGVNNSGAGVLLTRCTIEGFGTGFLNNYVGMELMFNNIINNTEAAKAAQANWTWPTFNWWGSVDGPGALENITSDLWLRTAYNGSYIEISIQDQHAFMNLTYKAARSYIDVRPWSMYIEGHLPGAAHYPNANLSADADLPWDTDEILFVNCKMGVSSRTGAETLVDRGYPFVFSMEGGFDEWKAEYPELVVTGPYPRNRAPLIELESPTDLTFELNETVVFDVSIDDDHGLQNLSLRLPNGTYIDGIRWRHEPNICNCSLIDERWNVTFNTSVLGIGNRTLQAFGYDHDHLTILNVTITVGEVAPPGPWTNISLSKATADTGDTIDVTVNISLGTGWDIANVTVSTDLISGSKVFTTFPFVLKISIDDNETVGDHDIDFHIVFTNGTSVDRTVQFYVSKQSDEDPADESDDDSLTPYILVATFVIILILSAFYMLRVPPGDRTGDDPMEKEMRGLKKQ